MSLSSDRGSNTYKDGFFHFFFVSVFVHDLSNAAVFVPEVVFVQRHFSNGHAGSRFSTIVVVSTEGFKVASSPCSL